MIKSERGLNNEFPFIQFAPSHVTRLSASIFGFRTQTELNKLSPSKRQIATHHLKNIYPTQWRSRGKRRVLRMSNPSLVPRKPSIAQMSLHRASIDSSCNSYNKYLSVAARVVRRSLKDDKRLAAERRGEMELRFAKWNVSLHIC